MKIDAWKTSLTFLGFGLFAGVMFKLPGSNMAELWIMCFFPLTFHYTGCFIGILIMLHHNPYITGQYHSIYTLTNQGFFYGSNSDCQLQAGPKRQL